MRRHALSHPVARIVAATLGMLMWWAPTPRAALLGCEIDASTVVFGNYSVYDTNPTDSMSGSVTYECFLALAVTIRINLSRGSAPSFSPRQMTSGANTLNYNLYRDAGRSTVWGDGTGGTSFFQVSIPLLALRSSTVTVFGRIPALQDAAVGPYTDTVVATVVF